MKGKIKNEIKINVLKVNRYSNKLYYNNETNNQTNRHQLGILVLVINIYKWERNGLLLFISRTEFPMFILTPTQCDVFQ